MPTRIKDPDFEGLTQQQIDLIEQFEADYNAVDRHLRKELSMDNQKPFTHVLSQFERRHPRWRDGDLLRMMGDLRNAIVHGKTEPYRHVAVPTPAVAQTLNQCRTRLLNPLFVIPKFQRTVEQMLTTHTLDHVLRMIAQRDYSQFPVYGGGHFKGLLTENGITRWMAAHVEEEVFGIKDITVSNVLRSEDTRPNYKFISRKARVDDLLESFTTEAMLEAVLITNAGNSSESLLGIVTRWDIIHLPNA